MSIWLPGTNGSYFSIGDVAPFNPAGAFSLYARFMPLAVTGTIVSKWQATADRSFLFDHTATAIQWNILGTNNTGYNGNFTLPNPLQLGQWHDVVAVATGSGLYVIFDGAQGPTGAQGAHIKNSTIGVTFGDRTDTPTPLKGFVERLATWDAALTIAEANYLRMGYPPGAIRRGSLSGWWETGELQDLSPSAAGGWTRVANATPAGSVDPGARFVLTAAAVIPAVAPEIDVPFIASTTQMFEQQVDRPVFVLPLPIRWSRN